jgi:hypothetical protein
VGAPEASVLGYFAARGDDVEGRAEVSARTPDEIWRRSRRTANEHASVADSRPAAGDGRTSASAVLDVNLDHAVRRGVKRAEGASENRDGQMRVDESEAGRSL